jgi:3-methylfumaryl-CoA hydratase
MNAAEIDIEELRKTIGRETTASDFVTPQQCSAFLATLDDRDHPPREGEPAPLAIHWCLAQPTAPASEIGADGHPARGGFLPAIPLPRRMWAGGELVFHAQLKVGEKITRVSRIADVSLKQGRTGSLCFVTVRHEISTKKGLTIEERQDIVYRSAETGTPAAVSATRAEQQKTAQWSRSVAADPVLLFRYSALTFNGHRIHYDRDYAVGQEHYTGLVVHGPLQATLLMRLAEEVRGRPNVFRFRGVRPLIDGSDFTVNAVPDGECLDLWNADAKGNLTMTAGATW